jgi:hypothetical protein
VAKAARLDFRCLDAFNLTESSGDPLRNEGAKVWPKSSIGDKALGYAEVRRDDVQLACFGQAGIFSFEVNDMKRTRLRILLVPMIAALLLSLTANNSLAQGQGASKQEMKQLNKEANKVDAKAEEASDQLGRKVVFCILAAHTTGVGTALELKTKFDALTDFSFGQFVAAVLLADRIDMSLDDILAKLVAGMSIGQITRDADVNMGEIRSHFGEFRSELARSETNPPTKNCFKSTP